MSSSYCLSPVNSRWVANAKAFTWWNMDLMVPVKIIEGKKNIFATFEKDICIRNVKY